MHAIALAITPHLTSLTNSVLHPFMVSVHLILVLPYIPKVVVVDIALMVVAPDAEAARYGSVGEDRGHVDASAA